ncbi:methylmalonyl-CoA mutase [Bacillus sp. B15-48]|nr:methylmalonyl-CoA mutase [Bacillus sp. B15-48]
MKVATFTPYSVDEWVAQVEQSLKGRKIETLFTSTYENIRLKPLYTKEEIDTPSLAQYPGVANFRRGSYSSGYHGKAWHVANKLSYDTVDELEGKLKTAFSAGQTAFALEVTEELLKEEAKLEALLKKYCLGVPFSVNAKGFLSPFLKRVSDTLQDDSAEATGFIGADLIAESAANGGFNQSESETFSDWAETIKVWNQQLPNVKTILVDTSIYHNSGANAVQELAIALATGVFYVQKLLDNGWNIEEALEKFVFHFSIGANFFMETAKLRAARILWNKAMEVYGAAEESRKMAISAETSPFTKTVFDPYVNLLRAGNEAFAAVLGGVHYLSVSTLDEATGATSSFSERIARNTQLILKAESHLEKVADPAGGSWYIEALTKELAEKAWEYFLVIEEQGDIVETLKANWLQKSIADVREQREKDIFTRKQSIIGTNVYAKVEEKVKQPQIVNKTKQAITFKPLQVKRLAEPFEELRFRALTIEKDKGKKPSVGLLCLGELKKHKARADFITGFLAAGGILAEKSEGLTTVNEAADFIEKTGLKHYCICGDQRQYNEDAINLLKDIMVKFPEIQVTMAGIPDETISELFKEAGINQFWHAKSNNYEILSTLMIEMEVSLDEK